MLVLKFRIEGMQYKPEATDGRVVDTVADEDRVLADPGDDKMVVQPTVAVQKVPVVVGRSDCAPVKLPSWSIKSAASTCRIPSTAIVVVVDRNPQYLCVP